MVRRLLDIVLYSLISSASLAAVAAGPRPEPLLFSSFETQDALAVAETHHTKVRRQSEHATDGRRALRIEFQTAEWPNLTFRAPTQAWSWKDAAALAVDVANPTDGNIRFSIRIDDDPRADGTKHCRTGTGHARAGRGATTFILSLGNAEPMDFGMRGLPGYTGTLMHARGEIDRSHVTAFQIFLHHPDKPTALVIDNIRLLPKPSLDGIVDAFGQFTGADWPGKLNAAHAFAERRAAERAAVAAAPQLPDRDAYGGWAAGPKRDATGFFRAARHHGKWWLVTPNGRLFFSLGMDCVTAYNATVIEQRRSMFTWLPPDDDPLSRYYGAFNKVHRGPVASGRTFDFFRANLHRKYGKDFLPTWREFAIDRLRAWGFNTIGNWSDWGLFDLRRMPYTVPLHIGGEHARLSGGSDYWAKMHDPFDPQFAEDVDKSLRVAERFRDDPWCLGYFVDNELSWGGGAHDRGRYGLAVGALAAPVDQPAKKAFLQWLHERYETLDKLNRAWQTSLENWDALARLPFRPAEVFPPAMRADCAAFTKHFAHRYFTLVRDTLAKYDPNHLYLGCRFASRTPEAVQAAAEVCSVVSFNIYRERVDPAEWAFATDLNKPCIIGEFHFGALDRGMFHTGLVGTKDQSARAAGYQTYVRSVIDHPAFVGCHWFQFVDQPLTGRVQDGENYNIGFLTVTDTPYAEMVAAARAVHAEAYRRRAGE